MKKLIAFAALGFLLGASVPALAGSQQEKMKMCNKDAKEKALKGDERKAFMKVCLSKKGAAPEQKSAAAPGDKRAAQQEKMKTCNKDATAKVLKGEERKKFMSACLKG